MCQAELVPSDMRLQWATSSGAQETARSAFCRGFHFSLVRVVYFEPL